MGEAMADQDMLHTAEVLKAALPYIDPRNRTRAEFITKMIDLMGSLRALKVPDNLAACGYEGTKVDMEGLLNGIRPVCNKKERDFVDRILNIFQVKRMYEMYNNIMSTMKAMQEFGGFDFGDQDVGDVTSNFSGANFESIFNSFNNTSEDSYTQDNNPEDSYIQNNSEDTYIQNNADMASMQNYFSENSTTQNNISESTVMPNHFSEDGRATEDNTQSYTYSDMTSAGVSDQAPGEDGYRDVSEDKSSVNQKMPGNNKMFFEMLKAMVPPEQLSTFENLSMVLSSMSYDNNSKPIDSEENNNG